MEPFTKLHQKAANALQRIDKFHFIADSLRVVTQHFLCALKGKSFFLYEVINRANIINVLLRIDDNGLITYLAQ